MNQDTTYLTERLRDAYEIEMSETTHSRQISAISAALKEQPTRVPAGAPLGASLRRRFAAVLAAATIFTPVAVAVAAEGTIPGDVLYPVKQVTEEVRSVFDPTIAARHRVEEANEMHQMGFPLVEVQRVLIDADNAITEAGEPVELRMRLIALMSGMGMDDIADGMSETRRTEAPPVPGGTHETPGANDDESQGTTPGHQEPSADRVSPGSQYQDMTSGDMSGQDEMTGDTTTPTGDMSGQDEMTGDTNHDTTTPTGDIGSLNHGSTPPTTNGDASGSWDGNEDGSGTGHDGGGEGDSGGSWNP